MEGYTAVQRKAYAAMISQLAQEWIVDRESAFQIDLERGVEWCPNMLTGDRTPRPNPTFTLTLRINGGASASDGPPIVAAPPVFKG
jgi:hypothetical protein